jgi:large subunit ribosomal protein L23
MNAEHLYTVIVAPHLSEKSTLAADLNNQAVFKVAVGATKPEIKKAVEKLFKVEVESVRVLNVKGKVKRNKFGLVSKPSWKKAYVTLKEGQDIDYTVAG